MSEKNLGPGVMVSIERPEEPAAAPKRPSYITVDESGMEHRHFKMELVETEKEKREGFISSLIGKFIKKREGDK